MGKSAVATCLFFAFPLPALAQAIAASYPGDAGIENNPNVVWVEMFEEGSVAGVVSRYDDSRSPENMALDADVPPGSGGTRSLRMFNGIAHVYKMFTSGYDEIFLRYYVKHVQPGYHHTNASVGGYNPPTPWPNPRAGTPSNGTDKPYLGYEPWWNQNMRFYCYSYGNQGPWGDGFPNDQNPIPWNAWLCVEVRFKLNSPGSANGEVGLWLDGQPKGTWQGVTYRTVSDLKINYLWVQHYAVDSNPPGVVKFDHIVMARSYIGPIGGGGSPPPPPPPAPPPPSGDADGDGMADTWETQFGLDPASPADASQDPDGDGFTNLREYQGGTNPNDPSSFPGSTAPPPPAGPAGGGAGSEGENGDASLNDSVCGATGIEALLLGALLFFRRGRR